MADAGNLCGGLMFHESGFAGLPETRQPTAGLLPAAPTAWQLAGALGQSRRASMIDINELAKALYEQDRPLQSWCDPEWPALTNNKKNQYRAKVRAVLKALHSTLRVGADLPNNTISMIDEALANIGAQHGV